MSQAAQPLKMTYAEYLEFEERSDVKHEFHDGHVYEVLSMSGGTLEHARLAGSFARELGVALKGRPCAVFSADGRVRVTEGRFSAYPDLSVVCGRIERASDDKEGLANPIVIVEVLSDSTEAFDRGDKFRQYRKLASLREYVLVSQREPLIEVHRKNDAGEWVLHEAVAGEKVRLASLDVSLDIDAIYRDPLAEAAAT
jgi:Uma2 family endonuclease